MAMSGLDPNYPLAAGDFSPPPQPRAISGDDYELAQRLANLPAYARSRRR